MAAVNHNVDVSRDVWTLFADGATYESFTLALGMNRPVAVYIGPDTPDLETENTLVLDQSWTPTHADVLVPANSVWVRGFDGKSKVIGTRTAIGEGEVVTIAEVSGLAAELDRIDILNVVPGADITATLQAAINTGRAWRLPAGVFLISTTLTSILGGQLFGVEGETTLRRTPASTSNAILNITHEDWKMDGIIFDGNRANNANPCNDVNVVNVAKLSVRNCQFINAKSSGGYGAGMTVNGVPYDGATSDMDIQFNRFNFNDGGGFTASEMNGGKISYNFAKGNGGDGIALGNYDVTFAQKLTKLIISGNIVQNNGTNGIVVGNLAENNLFPNSIWGFDEPEAMHVQIVNNSAYNNGYYGIIGTGHFLNISDNIAEGNSTATAGLAGIGFFPNHGVCSGNTVINNLGRGIEAGGARRCVISNNTIAGNPTVGMSAGGCIRVLIIGNYFDNNGGTFGHQTGTDRYDSSDNLHTFDWETSSVAFINNRIHLTGSQEGIVIYNGASQCTISGNHFSGPDSEKFIDDRGNGTMIRDNDTPNAPSLAIDGDGQLFIPDVFSNAGPVYVTNTGTISRLHWSSAKKVGDNKGIAWCNVTARGSGYTSIPTVTIGAPGGGGVQATAEGMISVSSGEFLGIRMLNRGSGYTSTPTVTITGGGGTGATATAQLGIPLGTGGKGAQIHFNAGPTTILQAGSPSVNSPGALVRNVVVQALDTIEVQAIFDVWRVMQNSNAPQAPAASVDNEIPRFDSTSGRVLQQSGVTISDTGVLAGAGLADVWTPVLTNGANVASSVAGQGSWMRLGNIVQCSLDLTVTPTAAGAATTEIEIAAPVVPAGNLTYASGVGACREANVPAAVQLTASASKRVRFRFNSLHTVAITFSITFQYLMN